MFHVSSTPPPSAQIFNVMTKLRDGGGIYVNGATNVTEPSLMAYNWVDRDLAVFAVFYVGEVYRL